MSIADRVKECIDKYSSDDLDNALIQICIAVDSTAKNEYPQIKTVGERFRRFITNNYDIITFLTLGNIVRDRFQVGPLTLEQFIYKVIRCGFLHEGKARKILKFVQPGDAVTFSEKQWCLPKTLVFGILIAVIGASSNIKERLPESYTVTTPGRRLKVNDLWGRIEIVRKLILPGCAV